MRSFSIFIATLTLVAYSLSNCHGQTTNVLKLPPNDSLPKPLGWTTDFEHLFQIEQIHLLDSTIAQYEKRTGVEIAIVTIDTTLTSKENFDDFVLQIHNAWGVGEEKLNNGIVIGISRGYRRMRISNGYGIEKYLSDAETKEIIDKVFIPSYKNAEYYSGTFQGLQALIQKLDQKMKQHN